MIGVGGGCVDQLALNDRDLMHLELARALRVDRRDEPYSTGYTTRDMNNGTLVL
jgi:hypothetical protein